MSSLNFFLSVGMVLGWEGTLRYLPHAHHMGRATYWNHQRRARAYGVGSGHGKLGTVVFRPDRLGSMRRILARPQPNIFVQHPRVCLGDRMFDDWIPSV